MLCLADIWVSGHAPESSDSSPTECLNINAMCNHACPSGIFGDIDSVHNGLLLIFMLNQDIILVLWHCGDNDTLS